MATDIAAHVALMGFSVQLFETIGVGGRAPGGGVGGRRARLPRLYTAAGYACFAGRPDAARHNAHRATELEAEGRYDACEPGYSMFIEALGQVYCGDLDRYVELTGEVATQYGAERGYALAAYVDGLQSAGRIDEAARAHGGVRRGRPDLRQSLLVDVRAVDRRHGVRAQRPAPRTCGVGRGHRGRSRTPGALLRGLPRPRRRRASTRRTENPKRHCSCSPGRSTRSSVPATSRSSSSPSRASRRCSRSSSASNRRRRCSARCRSSRRARTMCPSSPTWNDGSPLLSGGRGSSELIELGAAFDLDGAAVVRAGPDRRSPGASPRAWRARPPRRPEPPGGRGPPPRCRRTNVGRDRERAVHLDANCRAPHRQHLHEDRRPEPRRGDPLGHRQRRR